MSDELTLQYPAKIAPIIGLGVNEVNALKRKGCRFYRRKTCVAWVREYLDHATQPSKIKFDGDIYQPPRNEMV